MARLRTFSEWLTFQHDGDDMVARLARYAAQHPHTAHSATPEDFAQSFAGVYGGLPTEVEHALYVAGYRWRNPDTLDSTMDRALKSIQLHDLVFGLPPHEDPPGGPMPPIRPSTSARDPQLTSGTLRASREEPGHDPR